MNLDTSLPNGKAKKKPIEQINSSDLELIQTKNRAN